MYFSDVLCGVINDNNRKAHAINIAGFFLSGNFAAFEKYTAYTRHSIITSALDYLTIDSLPHGMRESNRLKKYRKLWAAHKQLTLRYILRDLDETLASRYD